MQLTDELFKPIDHDTGQLKAFHNDGVTKYDFTEALPADQVFKKITEQRQNLSGSHLSATGNHPHTNPLQTTFHLFL